MYNYLNAIKEDIKDWLDDSSQWSNLDIREEMQNRNKFEEQLNDDLWCEDGITGNLSGSYTCNSCEAREYVLDNMDLCKEALECFGTPANEIADKFLNENWEYLDVTIRCYLLGQAISEVLDELEDEMPDFEDEEE